MWVGTASSREAHVDHARSSRSQASSTVTSRCRNCAPLTEIRRRSSAMAEDFSDYAHRGGRHAHVRRGACASSVAPSVSFAGVFLRHAAAAANTQAGVCAPPYRPCHSQRYVKPTCECIVRRRKGFAGQRPQHAACRDLHEQKPMVALVRLCEGRAWFVSLSRDERVNP